MMTYQETIDYLFSQLPVFQVIGPGAYKPGLETAYKLAGAFGDPHKCFKSIHIAGTNGKGSTSHMIASVLAEAGYKVGLYTSPHIFDFRERIRVNGEKITEEAVVDFVERYRDMGLSCEPSFFELTTIMAFDYFKACGVDVAVIETGLGGRLDTTNIINPLISVITNVSLDHTALLGNTETEIAAEKAGIIKSGVPAVIGEATAEVREVFEDTAKRVGAKAIFAEDNPYKYESVGDHYIFALPGRKEPDIYCDLTGEFQAKNINTVLTALKEIDIADNAAIRIGLSKVRRNTGLFGRWTEMRLHGRNIVFDTGHNIGAWQYLAPRLQKIASGKGTLRIVLGFSNDKEIGHIFDQLPKNAVYYFVRPSVKRGRDPLSLLAMANERGLYGRAFDTVTEGYNKAIVESSETDTIFVGGSNFVVADVPESL